MRLFQKKRGVILFIINIVADESMSLTLVKGKLYEIKNYMSLCDNVSSASHRL